MKIEINIRKEPLEVIISEEIADKDSIKYLTELFDLIESKGEFLFQNYGDNSADIVIDEEEEKELKLEAKNLVTDEEIKNVKESVGNINLLKLSKDSKLPIDKLELFFDVHNLENKVYPLISPLKDEAVRTKNQRKAILIFLYENFVINNEMTLSSRDLTNLFLKSNMEGAELNKAYRTDNTGFVKTEGQNYRITHKGIIEARKMVSELIQII